MKKTAIPATTACILQKNFEAKDALLVVLESVAAVKENFRQEYIIDFVKGRATDDIVSHKQMNWRSLEQEKIWMLKFGILLSVRR